MSARNKGARRSETVSQTLFATAATRRQWLELGPEMKKPHSTCGSFRLNDNLRKNLLAMLRLLQTDGGFATQYKPGESIFCSIRMPHSLKRTQSESLVARMR